MSKISKTQAWALIDADGNVVPEHTFNTRKHARATLKHVKEETGLRAVKPVTVSASKNANAWALVDTDGQVNTNYMFRTRAAARTALSGAKVRTEKTGNMKAQYAQLSAVRKVKVATR